MIKDKLKSNVACIINPELLRITDSHKKTKTHWFLGTALSILSVFSCATAAQATTIPPNPAQTCTVNWHRWQTPRYASGSPIGVNPTTHGYAKIDTVLGADTWYEQTLTFIPGTGPMPADGIPNEQFGYSTFDNTTENDKKSRTARSGEAFYGVAKFELEPNVTTIIPLNDGAFVDGHAFMAYDSAGTPLARFPSASAVASGKFYIGANNKTPTIDAEGVHLNSSWTDNTFEVDVPADGLVFVHYVLIDESAAHRHALKYCPQDVGDAPSTYGVAGHTYDVNLRLGSAKDVDINLTGDAAAASDDNDGNGDNDEDGVTIPALKSGESATIPVAATGAGGFLQGWVDFDGSGTFEASEQIATNLQLASGTSGTINVPIDVPADAVTTQTFARFRWSTTSGLDASTAAPDGEVEDYALTITEAATPIDAVNDDFTSAAIPSTGGTTASVFADDDYDGATPTETSVDVSLTDLGGLTGATINADGTIDVPAGATAGTYTLTYKICEAGATTNCDTATVKIEVEAPAPAGPPSCSIAQSVSESYVPSRTLNTSCVADVGVTSDGVSGNPGYCPLSLTSDYEITYAYNLPADDRMYSLKVWSNAGGAFYDGELRTFDLEVDYTNSSGAPATLAMGNVNLGDTTSINDPKSVTFMDGGQPVSLPNVTKVRISNLGHASTGPVFRELQGVCGDDFSDAPATYLEASHKFDPQMRLGATNTPELAASNSNNDDGDDGVTLPALEQGKTATITVAATGAGGFLQGWVDFDGSGTFEAGEQVATNLQLASGTTGTINVPIDVPADAATTQTFARFRWSTTSSLDASTAANDGEVEDYALTITQTPIDAVNDDFTSTAIPATGGTTASVFADDDYDGALPTETTVDVSLTDLGGLTGATINTDGTIDVPAGAAAGTYTLTYKICEAGATTNCDTATVKIEVEAPPTVPLPPRSTSIEVCKAPAVGAFTTNPSTANGQVAWLGNNPVQTLTARLNSSPPPGFNPSGTDFMSAAPFTVGPGASLSFAGTAIAVSGINQNSVEAALADGDYIDYTFTTASNMPTGRTFNNATRQSFVSARHNFDMTILVSDDPTFATAHTVVEDASITVQTRTFHPFSDALVLQPSTQYYVRILTYNNTTSSGDVGYDDLVLSTVLCADYADGPVGYLDATHAQQLEVHTHFLGNNISNDVASIASSAADADGNTDDGVTLPALKQGASATITVAATGAGGFLQGWIDFDGSGTFETGEKIATNLQLASGTSGTINVPINVPSDAVTTQTFARFRWSTTNGLDASTAAPDGEVEDYAVIIEVTPIDAVDDDFTSTAIPSTGGTTASVFADDDYNGATPTETSVDVTLTDLGGLTGATINADGTIDVPAGVTAGTYTLTYRICEAGATTLCDTATVKIEVEAVSADLSITKTNTPGVNGEVDQADDTVTTGQTTTYTLVVTNNGPDSATGAVVKDVPGSGLTCTATDAVTLSGDGVPTGSFTIADLTGTGITLDTLADGQATTLSYSCVVD